MISSKDWIEKNINLTHLTTSAVDGNVTLDAYQIPIFQALDTPSVRQVTVMACERLGKSVLWQWYLLYRLAIDPIPSLVIYRSDEEAADTNRDTVEPLMCGIPKLATELEKAYSKRKDSYHFSDSITYFQGSGTPILSKTVGLGIMDELDFHQSEQLLKGKQDKDNTTVTVSNLMNLEKRLLNFRRQNLSKLIAVSSPTNPDSPIDVAFNESSAGHWSLTCLKCKNDIPSHSIYNLQWELDDKENIINDSIRLICPKCQERFTEDKAEELNRLGSYDHHKNEVLDHKGFQFGALACPRVWSWMDIAKAQMRAGKTADLRFHKYLDNTVRGLPYKIRRKQTDTSIKLKDHCYTTFDSSTIKAVFLAADTQTYTGWYYTIRALMDSGDTYLLKYGKADTLEDLKKVWNTKVLDKYNVMAGVIDTGGHRTTEVQTFISATPGIYGYKGDTNTVYDRDKSFKLSSNVTKLILAHPYNYQEQLLYQIYTQTDKEQHPYWYIQPEITDDYLKMIESVQPSKTKINGNQYRNWAKINNADYEDHYFDSEKMLMVLVDFAESTWNPSHWINKTVPTYLKDKLLAFVNSKKRISV